MLTKMVLKLFTSSWKYEQYEGLIMMKLTANFQEIMSTSDLQKWAVTVWRQHDVRKMFWLFAGDHDTLRDKVQGEIYFFPGLYYYWGEIICLRKWDRDLDWRCRIECLMLPLLSLMISIVHYHHRHLSYWTQPEQQKQNFSNKTSELLFLQSHGKKMANYVKKMDVIYLIKEDTKNNRTEEVSVVASYHHGNH